ncbi:PREDICTED: zinc-finger homeodomain protein 10-like [Acromyrmex echinatior]|uniref:zinc-finger homeodomain protein 10-like n=1 Tax=Acromyrmex echinatior TaxID=103372 RepID=UPI000580C512|nr:PREDICTED: zinc-finger homeodomain protein 10-like [Acromyrmex echinatior]
MGSSPGVPAMAGIGSCKRTSKRASPACVRTTHKRLLTTTLLLILLLLLLVLPQPYHYHYHHQTERIHSGGNTSHSARDSPPSKPKVDSLDSSLDQFGQLGCPVREHRHHQRNHHHLPPIASPPLPLPVASYQPPLPPPPPPPPLSPPPPPPSPPPSTPPALAGDGSRSYKSTAF